MKKNIVIVLLISLPFFPLFGQEGALINTEIDCICTTTDLTDLTPTFTCIPCPPLPHPNCPPTNPERKNAVIIGASFGMGKELAHLLADAGYTLGLAARRTSLLNDLADELDTDTFIKKIDISKPVAAARLLQELIDSMGGVDLVVITAGMWRDIDEFEQEDDYKAHFSINFAAEKKAIDTNVVGFTAMCSVALNNFLCQRSGHLVAITSIDALRGNAACPIYSATKSFDSKYLEGIRYKMRERRLPIAITEIRPGYVSTYDVPENAYWVTTPQEAAKQIFKAIRNKQKVAYVSKRWAIVGALMRILPDWLYTSIGGL